MLDHEVALFEIGQHLLDRLGFRALVTLEFNWRTGRTFPLLVFYFTDCPTQQISDFGDAVSSLRVKLEGQRSPVVGHKHCLFCVN